MKLGIFSCNFLVFVVLFGICRVQLDVDGEINGKQQTLCPVKWKNSNAFCYHYFNIEKTKAEADMSCEQNSSHLLYIHSEEENNFVLAMLKATTPAGKSWLGLQLNQSTFRWDHGGKNYSKFQASELRLAHTRKVYCAVINGEFSDWTPAHCVQEKEQFICKGDADECSSGLNECHHRANCTNTYGSYMCNCTFGFTGNGTSCQDVDECGLSLGHHSCDNDSRVVCENNYGSYTCNCTLGFTGNGTKAGCQDYDECLSRSHNCDINANCTNTEGSHTCNCTLGFTGNGTRGTCQDIDECFMKIHDCNNDTRVVCENNNGSYTCKCSSGFTGNGTKAGCQDYDECLSKFHNCNTNANCTNTDGSYSCNCALGFTGNGTRGTCQDVDECLKKIHNCDDDTRVACENNIGSFTCDCSSGFYGNGTKAGCQGKQCNTSSNVTNLIISFNLSSSTSSNISMANYNETIFFFCENELKRDGSPNSTCLDNGWTSPFPECLNVNSIIETSPPPSSSGEDSSWLKDHGLIIVTTLAAVLLISVVAICYSKYCKRMENKKPPAFLYSSDNGGRGNSGTTLTRPYQNVSLSERVQNNYELTPVAACCTEVQAET